MDAAPRALCPVCGSPAAKLRYRLSQFSVLRCRECEQVYLWPLLTEEEVRELFSRLYTVGEGSVPELRDYYRYCYEDHPTNPLVQLYEHWLDGLERHRTPGRLLDVGCGTGLFLAVARRRGWEPFGIDECTEATDYARDHFGLDVWVGEFSEVGAQDGPFDAITMWDIIEHARSPLTLLKAVRRCLASDGVVGLSTPNQRNILDRVAGAMYRGTRGRLIWPLEKFYIEQHFLYFTPTTLGTVLGRAGLSIVDLEGELTDLRRLTLSPPMRLVLRTLFRLARLTGLENRLFAVARASELSPNRPGQLSP